MKRSRMKAGTPNPKQPESHAASATSSTHSYSGWLLAAIAGIFFVVLIRTAWICDDAYITFRSITNFLQGTGLTWNTVERVQAYTHPLWLFLHLPLCALDIDPYYASFVLSLLCMAGALSLLTFRIASNRWMAAIALALLLGSRAFVDYSTGGLENPLSHVLLGFLVVLTFRSASAWNIVLLWFLAGLALMTRMDLVLFFSPALISSLIPLSRPKLRDAVLGLSPFIAWEIFSIVYYGFPFPNSAYAKLGTGIEATALIQQGLYYLMHSVRSDPVTALLIPGALAVSWWRGGRRERLLATGCILYVLYVVWIGGDFMAGRFLSAPFFLSICLLSRTARVGVRVAIPALASLAVLLLAWPSSPVRSGPKYGLGDASKRFYHGIADERACYYERTGLLNLAAAQRESLFPHPWVVAVQRLAASGSRARFVPAGGRFSGHLSTGSKGYLAGPHVYVVDSDGLADPFLARLPVSDRSTWRIGHFRRNLPAGYEETLRTGTNQIEDPELASFYDRIAIVVRGPIWDRRRFREIIRLNLGW